ncbi:MAG: hypothetical protein R3261_15010 [Alphaproteobacteria bacterium]|nr:hypothetical protein [Alphaproteobacteria bacterium]
MIRSRHKLTLTILLLWSLAVFGASMESYGKSATFAPDSDQTKCHFKIQISSHQATAPDCDHCPTSHHRNGTSHCMNTTLQLPPSWAILSNFNLVKLTFNMGSLAFIGQISEQDPPPPKHNA